MGDISKEAVLYIHIKGSDYQCSECVMFKPRQKRCSIHHHALEILPNGSCGLFYLGKPAGKQSGYLTLAESGYEESPNGFSCKRCANYDQIEDDVGDCAIVDPDSDGDDPGVIHADACCNAWEPIR